MTAAAVTVGLLAAGTTAGDTAASPANPPGSLHGCTLTTTANTTTTFDVFALLATVRNNDDVYEVLYNAHCPDGRSDAIWIAG